MKQQCKSLKFVHHLHSVETTVKRLPMNRDATLTPGIKNVSNGGSLQLQMQITKLRIKIKISPLNNKILYSKNPRIRTWVLRTC